MPVQWVDQVTQALVVDDAGDVVFVWQDDSLRAGNTELRGKGSLEELVVCRPHERIIDHSHSLQDSILEVKPVIRYFVRNTINNHRVGTRLVHARTAQLDELGDNIFVAAVNFFNECRRKGPFSPDKQADFQGHKKSPLSI